MQESRSAEQMKFVALAAFDIEEWLISLSGKNGGVAYTCCYPLTMLWRVHDGLKPKMLITNGTR